MYVIEQSPPEPAPIPGLAHTTLAGQAEGLRHLSVWRQSIAAGAATPPHRHDCEEVVLCSGGEGELHIAGEVHRFQADTTLVIPANEMHQILNTGAQPMEIVGVFSTSPVQVFLPDGAELPLPWRT